MNFQQINKLYAFYYLVLFRYQLFFKEDSGIIFWNLDWNLFSMSHLSTLFNSNLIQTTSC